MEKEERDETDPEGKKDGKSEERVKTPCIHSYTDTHTTSLTPPYGLSFYFSQLGAPGQITISPSQKHFSSRDHEGG